MSCNTSLYLPPYSSCNHNSKLIVENLTNVLVTVDCEDNYSTTSNRHSPQIYYEGANYIPRINGRSFDINGLGDKFRLVKSCSLSFEFSRPGNTQYVTLKEVDEEVLTGRPLTGVSDLGERIRSPLPFLERYIITIISRSACFPLPIARIVYEYARTLFHYQYFLDTQTFRVLKSLPDS